MSERSPSGINHNISLTKPRENGVYKGRHPGRLEGIKISVKLFLIEIETGKYASQRNRAHWIMLFESNVSLEASP